MPAEYKMSAAISIEKFIDILQRSTLGERRLCMTLPAWEEGSCRPAY